ncbi:ComEA family DNA-binding protein [Serratia odorifera]|jgi:competence protein ComEA|uniref:Competence protein ComEA helix-hairpin-helix repeat region n=2 Tax=Serratia odorifera TaxID=618 RepID=D4DW96_SEROD|nr:ComEA family DNA-binding protein [Serratia odorifera]EFE98151.1 competence protein ComEA helix-hairpin-helix repeat region [Serratia odorifera DSM 4582]MBJ2065691.1 helix-hairpin-helix domain-containing protein [Serratia odorifera]PNK92575.1 competence protein ComEA [Serratia odorifera]RII73733.1 helix-hairpin-helix domain-containing protein [Serratia odorifera]VDZ51837.1 competence protein ComEA helix-hairpin-helix repeat region [Serratia odorifera]
MTSNEISQVQGYRHSIKTLLATTLLLLTLAPAMAAEKPAAGQKAATTASAAKAPTAAAEVEATVSINQADAEQLASVLNGVGLKKAEAIVRYREQHGPFTEIDQLQEVPGIGLSLFERNRGRLKM